MKTQKYYRDTSNFWYFYRPGSQGTGDSLSFDMTRGNEILNYSFPDSGKYIVSFWFEGANMDLWPVTYLNLNIDDSTGKMYLKERISFFNKTIMRDNSRGLVEFPIYIKGHGDTFRLSLYNRFIIHGTMNMDRILIRRSRDDMVIRDGEELYLNNRLVENNP